MCKSEITEVLLQKPKLQQWQLSAASSSSEDNASDEENKPPAKKICDRSSNVSKVVRYDGFNHWPVFVSAVTNTRCKNGKCAGKHTERVQT
jgi:hypothetical protein